MIFKKGHRVKLEGEAGKIVLADEEHAAFVPMDKDEDDEFKGWDYASAKVIPNEEKYEELMDYKIIGIVMSNPKLKVGDELFDLNNMTFDYTQTGD